ncbi:E3 ubiquitin-protein ligase SINA-like 2 [Capsella rubella]|nr:E3 ubiquitin-protein ligase SINA-like 2 [Capsella rubella]
MGVYNDLKTHYYTNHKDTMNEFVDVSSSGERIEKVLVIQMDRSGPLVAVQFIKEQEGFYLTVKSIAPSAPGVEECSYDISYSYGGKTMRHGSSEMKKVRKLCFKKPKRDFMLVPNFLIGQHCPTSDIEICIGKPKKDDEEEEADEEDVKV